MAHISPTSLTNLCMFGADVGSRLVRLAKWVDGMPSAVKSLGYEIWAACEVLCELANILARAQKNLGISFFNAGALKEIEDYLGSCDEIFHEAARGVIVAYDRIKAIRQVESGKQKAKEPRPNPNKKRLTPEVICLSFSERAQWPLFQQRMKSMMETLLHSKSDLTLHLMVYWAAWERESSRKSKSSIFSQYTAQNRDTLVDTLWHNKVRRDQDIDSSRSTNWSPAHSNSSTKAPSIFALSNSGSSSPDDTSNSSSPSSPVSTRSNDSLFKRLGKKLSQSSKKSLVAMGFITKHNSENHARPSMDVMNQRNGRTPAGSRSPSLEQGSSFGPQTNGQHARQQSTPIMRRVQSSRPPLRGNNGERHSLLSLTESQSSFSRPQIQKRSSWCAGPTKSAKEGILREWEVLRINEDDLLWQNDEELMGADSEDYRDLGQQLLFRQLQALIPVWAVQDNDQVGMTIDMLIENWIEPGQFRQRRMEWESVVDGRTSASYQYVSANDIGQNSTTTENKFHFTPT